jgi:hypothetical protein
MSDQDNSNQYPTSDDDKIEGAETTGQQQQTNDPTFGQPETGEAQDGDIDTLTETDQQIDGTTGEQGTETTGETESGFVASKDQDSGDYLQEKDEQSGDVEGSTNFATNGE